jgi:putative salt-induced outer membrane protein
MWNARVGRVVAAVASLLIVSTAAAAGQAVPTPPSAPPPPPPRVEGTGELSFVTTTGNSSTSTIGLAAGLIYRPSAWVIDSKVAFVRTEANSTVSARSVTASSRLARDLSPRSSLFVQYDFLNSPFAGISQRHTVAAGVSYKAVDDARNTLRLDLGLGFYKLKLSDTSEFTEEARIVESLSHSDDWRFDNSAAVAAKLTTALSLKVSHVTHVVNRPTPGFKKTDTILAAAVVAKF